MRFSIRTGCVSLLIALPACGATVHDKTAEAMARLDVVFPREVEQRLALSAAPEHLRAGAGIYLYTKRGYERVRAAANGFTCLVNRDAFFYGIAHFKPTCWDAQGATTYLPVMLKVGEMLAHHESADAIRKAIEDGFAGGQFRAPESSGIAYMLAGDLELDDSGRITRQVYPGHYMFYANKVTNEQLGFTADAARKDPTLPFVATIGAGGAHGLSYIIAVPGEAHAHSTSAD